MCGIDVHMDPNIGKRLNALGNTLTSLTGEEDIDDIADLNSVNMADLSDEDEPDTMSPTIHMVSHPPLSFISVFRTVSPKKRFLDMDTWNKYQAP